MPTICPECGSTHVYHVRHDSDWGSTNTMYRINEDKYYPKETEEMNEYGDINFFYCSQCHTEWF